MLDALVIVVARIGDRWAGELAARSGWDWLWFFLPLVLLEVPRYHLPLFGLLVARAAGFPRRDEVRERAFEERCPSVTVVIAGRNEAETLESCIRSLCDQEYPNLEIVVVDDASEDETERIAARYVREGRIRYVRNRAASGRGGRPAASNLGLAVANGEFLVSLDADTTFDRGMIRSILRPFADPRVGVVAGNVFARNVDVNLLTRLQQLEYMCAIDVAKRWSSLWGRTLQASGAIGAFRTRALKQLGGWDPELAEDGDISLRIVKAGWRTAFAPDAVSITDLPTRLRVLMRQRTRWDRGGFRAYFAKHHRLLRPSVSGWSYAFGMWGELLFGVVLPIVYPLYLAWLALQGPVVFGFVTSASFVLYTVLSVLPVVVMPWLSRRAGSARALLGPALVSTPYRELLRWVRVRALWLELFHLRYEDGFLPDSAWANAPRF